MEKSESSKNSKTLPDAKTPKDKRKVNLSEVKKRLDAEKKKLANVRKKKMENKSKGKSGAAVKRKQESRRSVETAAKRRKVETPKIRLQPESKKKKSNTKSTPKSDSNKKSDLKVKQEIKEEDIKKEVIDHDESSDEIPLATLKKNQENDVKESSIGGGFPPDTEFTIGFKVEAMDSNFDWYPARVIEVDNESKDVLVHFERWSSRYDEWIPMISNRLRQVSALSRQSNKGKLMNRKLSLFSPVSKRKGTKLLRDTDTNTAPSPSIASTSNIEKTLFKIDDQVMASWSDSRKYPARVLEVLENDSYKVLFYDGFVKITKAGKMSINSKSTTHVHAPVPTIASIVPPVLPAQPDNVEDIGSKADRRERKRKINVSELFGSFRRRSSPPSKTATPNNSSGKIQTPKSSTADGSAHKSETTTKKGKAGRTPKTPSPGQEDLMLINKNVNEAEAANKTKTKSGEPKRMKTILPRTSADGESATAPSEETPPAQPPAILEGIEIEMDGDNFKCPACGKLHRKENLLQMHIKHYHPELKSKLMTAPKVSDLAYARTVSDLPSTAVMHRTPAISTAVNTTTTTTTTSSIQRKSITPATRRPSKIADKIDGEKTADIQSAPLPSIGTPAKTGQIKTILPVNRTNEEPPPQLSALQQALMSPPGQITALLQQTLTSPVKTPTKLSEGKALYSPSRQNISPRSRTEKSPNKDSKELVNCRCGICEEDGLMIQCDICMCWQHGICNSIETEDQVPDKYICHVCLNPTKERLSKKYAHDQDWLKEGVLPRMPIRRNLVKAPRSPTEILLKEIHDITASIINIQNVMHSLRVKLNIAAQSDHPKLYLWSKKWDTDVKSPVKVQEMPKLNDTTDNLALSQTVLDSTDLKLPLSQTMLDPCDLKLPLSQTELDLKLPLSQTELDNSVPLSQTDLAELKLPISQSELDQLANTVENNLISSGEVPAPAIIAKAPEPEAPIKPMECRLVLLEHIKYMQEKLDERLIELEKRVDELESQDPELMGDDSLNCTRTKETLRMLQRDLNSVTKISNYASIAQ